MTDRRIVISGHEGVSFETQSQADAYMRGYNSRATEAEQLRKENEELKAKLRKAKDALRFYAFCQGQDGNIGYRARTTLKEIEK